MEVELVTEGLSEDEFYNIDDIIEDHSNFEGERCGICMDIVVDRGVLDCCQHWFCFTCIDNWATITNLCPLCQNEFQLITCVPVYDTIGNNKSDEDTHSRDDEWCADGNNNTLSLPAYYIDENAVACLDGDDCKIRSGSAATEGENLDTSIACDLCDKWYHAFCVQFDTESNCEESWLCPRCLIKETPERSDESPLSRRKQLGQENASHECLVRSSLAGKVSISIADVGETAVVVSMVEGDKVGQESSGHFPIGFGKDLKVDAPLPNSVSDALKLEVISHEGSNVESKSGAQGLELSLSGNTFSPSPSHTLGLGGLMTNSDEKKTGELILLDGLKRSSSNLSAAPINDKFLESGLDLHLGLSVGSSSPVPVDLLNNEGAKDQMRGYELQKYDLGECPLPADKAMDDEIEVLSTKRIAPDHRENAVAGAKRKQTDSRYVDGGESKSKTEAKYSLKKVKAEGKSKLSQSKDQADEYQSRGSRKITNTSIVAKDETFASDKEQNTNIMHIVQERRKPLRQLPPADPADRPSKARVNASGVRVKKIMRKASNDKDSSLVVQRLRREIREAVRNKSSKELGENLFDQKLLAAFRAVVAGQTTETKRMPVDLKAKKALLQKGKVREHLTKKIYGGGGKRRRAWTRDCDIEFWKYRCSQVSKPEKINTLKSVLDLLRNDSDDKRLKGEKEGEASNTFLSRLYLADSSVLPRKDDIKPASAHEVAADRGQNKEHRSSEEASTPSSSNLSDISGQKNEILSRVVNPPLDTKAIKKSILDTKHETESSKQHPNKCLKGPSGATKATLLKKSVDYLKSDKRKWALELLARKTAIVGNKQETDDNASLKGNYPLLAQLPKDMRPELAPIRHNKIPASVRQAQLCRLAEHLLRKVNLPAIRITAETELAIADAINIEKEIANRSNSKLVYVNLCSQELLSRTDTNSVEVAESNASTSEVIHDKSEASSEACNDPAVDEALRAAGLLSDSPPGSPREAVCEIKEKVGLPENIEDDGPDNIFEVDSHPDLDIYGDFDYSLEDDDFIGASALKIFKPEPEDSKIKVVLSTVNKTDRLDGTLDILDDEKAATEIPEVPSELPDCRTSFVGSGKAVSADTCPSQSSTLDVGEEPSLAECEELYGPDKEPLVNKYPEQVSIKPSEPLASAEIPGVLDIHASRNIRKELENESNMEDTQKTAGLNCPPLTENSSSHSQKSENAIEEKNRSKSETSRSDCCNLVAKKVEGYIKEHIRPLCKSGVITVEQYRWAVGKTTEKVMKYHSKDKNANFLIKEGDKVKKLAEQYVETAQQTTKDH